MSLDIDRVFDCVRPKETNPTITPFRGVRYNSEKDQIEVIAEPHPVIQLTEYNPLVLIQKYEGEETSICIGFYIKNAKRLCVSHGLPIFGPTLVSRILRVLCIDGISERAKEQIKTIALPLLLKHHIDEFEFPIPK